MTYRVLVSTDLGGDPDDIQSLYRLIHYSDVLKVEAITSCTGPGSTPSADLIRGWIQRVDVDHLRACGHSDLMDEASLLKNVVQGAVTKGAPSAARRTEASDRIIARAHAEDPERLGRPLWVLVWGSITDVAQALHDDPSIAPRIRINFIGSSNTKHDPESREYVYDFMESEYPHLWWIEDGIMPHTRYDTFRGVYEGGDQSGEWHNIQFIEENIKGHGSTHGGMFDELCGDVFPGAIGDTGALKEGDTPTMLHLVSPVFGGVGDVDDPTAESWGGRYRHADADRFPNYYVDLDEEASVCRGTIAKWRRDILGHWKQRWDWYE